MNLIAQRSPSATHSGRTVRLSLVGVGTTTKRGIEVGSQYDNHYSSNVWLGQELTSCNSHTQEDCYGKWK